jgi:TM2 domain-containing membrane protein YozV
MNNKIKITTNYITISVVLVIISSLITSCSIEKRKYLSGYYINGFKKRNNVSNLINPVNESTKININDSEKSLDLIFASSETNNYQLFNKKYFTEKCDILVFKNGNEVEVKITELDPKQIKYKKCGDIDGITYTVYKSDVVFIRHLDGTKEVFEQKAEELEKNPVIINNNNNNNNSMQQQQQQQEAIVKAQPTKNKHLNKITAIILCIFLGYFGIHRFYLGYPILGVLYLLTGALCGIGVIVDLILLCTGDLKPVNGEFDDE